MTTKNLLKTLVLHHTWNFGRKWTKLYDYENINIEDSGTFNRQKRRNIHGWYKYGGIFNILKLNRIAVISRFHIKLFSVVQELLKGLQVTPEVNSRIVKNDETIIRFNEKITN